MIREDAVARHDSRGGGPPRPILAIPARLCAAVVATMFVIAFWSYAQRASQQAVAAAAQALSPHASRVTLPRVEIVARRSPPAHRTPI